ncbi:methylmalonyl-CoA epimerase [Isosphaera pallida ATCC 43644]|jgi:methylmalonyl-CoA/ethylmalonyl-CoA epimerase|uniref:Methylmalonyl-CoA epimerase n=1 Tax=Isosphaera pallida (strain ATCC 43644 / DSM 9630 / IS1B) TaxID=575540 RepID=E8QZN7_ISOPI|nr:methylmalonyl-CoA epimerase [Isosphaera pallida]ADV62173.1 methylmalonyl-CoA epimerase [Isosphaera pallida ATCC 43644]
MQPVQDVNHLGIAVRSIDAHRQFYETCLGAVFESIEEVPDQKVRVAFLKVGGVHIELLEPTAEDSPISKFLEKKGEGLHHVAYTVTDLKAKLAELREAGVALLDQTPRAGSRGMAIAFLHPKAGLGVLTELCQPAGSHAASA